MSVPDRPSEVRQRVAESTSGPVAEVLERLAEKLGGTATVSAVFGDPVECGGTTIIPVAKVGFGLGAGGRWESMQGGGGGASAAPVGYIAIKDGNAVFKPIRDPLVDVLVPLAAVIAGSAGLRIVRKLRGR